MIFNSILTLLKSNVNYLQLLHNKHFITAIENIRFEIYFVLVQFKHAECFTSHGDYLLNTTLLSSWCRIFSSRSGSRKIRILSISKFFCLLLS